MNMIMGMVESKELFNLVLTSKALHNIAEPFLRSEIYRDIELIWGPPDVGALTKLIRTILENPELGQYVCNLSLRDEGQYGTSDDSEDATLPYQDSDWVYSVKTGNFIRESRVPSPRDWIDGVRSRNTDATVALLLSMLPNLTRFFINGRWIVGSRFLGALLRSTLYHPSPAMNCPLHKFRKLRYVSFPTGSRFERTRGPRYIYHNPDDIAPLFYLPKVEVLKLALYDPYMPVPCLWPATHPNASALLSLELSHLRENRLWPILKNLTGLTEFNWHCFTPGSYVSRDRLDVRALTTALSQVANTLTDLSINIEVGASEASIASDQVDPIEFRGGMVGFKLLVHLKRLKIPWALALGLQERRHDKYVFNKLPSSLEKLTLTNEFIWSSMWMWTEYGMAINIRDGLESREAGCLPNLREVTLPVTKYKDMIDETRKRLREISARVGVKLKMLNGADVEDDSPTGNEG